MSLPALQDALLHWFAENGRDLPWRRTYLPYHIWISEIMLQQTVVTAAVDHFNRWMDLFPDVSALARADEQSVLKAWEGLGYYSRARNIRKGALYLMEHHGGSLPASYDELIKIPGIGDYTARAVLSLAFSRPYPVLDANVRRIGQRLIGRREWSPLEDRLLLEGLTDLIPPETPGVFNCALMQLGQLVCRVKSPGCGACPLKTDCRTRLEGLQDEIPVPKKRKISEKSSTLFILVSGGRVLLTRRSAGIGRGLWFLPAVPAGEEDRVLELLGSLVLKEELLPGQVHLYTTWRETLRPLRLDLAGDPDFPVSQLAAHPDDDTRWIPLDQIEIYPSPSVYRIIMNGISRDSID